MTKQDFNAFKYSVIAVIGGLIFGLDAGIISGGIKYIKANLGLNALEVGSVVSAPGFGAIIAYLFVGYIVAKFGRKNTLIGIAFCYLLSATLSTVAVGYYSLLIGRLIGGVAFMSISITSMYVGEVSPTNLRGKLVSANQILIGLGFFIAYLINYLIVLASPSDPVVASHTFLYSNEHIWRFMIGVIILPCFIWFILLFTIQESPRWLLLKGREEDARKVLEKLTPAENIDALMTEIKLSIAEATKINLLAEAKILFSPKMRTVLILGAGLSLSQSAAGLGIISYYAPLIFEQVGIGAKSALFQTTLLGALGTGGSILAMLVVEKIGRRPILILGAISILLCHSTLWYTFKGANYQVTPTKIEQIQKTHPKFNLDALQQDPNQSFKNHQVFHEFMVKNYDKKFVTLNESVFIKAFVQFPISSTFIVFAIFLFKFTFFFSVGPLTWVVLSEVVPVYTRSFSLPFFGFLMGVLAWATTKFFPWQLETLGISNTFLFYAILAIVSLLFVLKFLPETKNKSLEELERVFTKK